VKEGGPFPVPRVETGTIFSMRFALLLVNEKRGKGRTEKKVQSIGKKEAKRRKLKDISTGGGEGT